MLFIIATYLIYKIENGNLRKTQNRRGEIVLVIGHWHIATMDKAADLKAFAWDAEKNKTTLRAQLENLKDFTSIQIIFL
jgi:hypothetical protein